MATVNMNCVEFYNPNPKPALKASQAQLTKPVLNKHRLPIQPSRSPPAGDVQHNDSFDDSLPSLEELLRPPQNREIPQVPLIDEGRLLADARPRTRPMCHAILKVGKPLIIEDDSDDESDDEAEVGVTSSDLLASIGDQDVSENGLAT
ncbi:hypothetical protein ACLOAV_010490 [Pseudogymnoascus australis]